MTSDLKTFLAFVAELEELHASYRISVVRPNALLVEIAVPGERWEVEFLDDGVVEVERFRSRGEIAGADALDELRGLLQ